MTISIVCASVARFSPSRYTGKERDTESGNDYMFARYYNSSTGRFLSPDWSAKEDPVPYAKLENPQTLNLYGYMQNSPLGGVDQDGHCDWCQKLWNGVTGKGFKTDAQISEANANVSVDQDGGWTTDTGGDFGSTTGPVDLTGGASLQAGGSVGYGGGSISYTPGTGEIDLTVSGGAMGTGASATVSSSAPATGFSDTVSGFFGVGGSVSIAADGSTSTSVGIGTPGASISVDHTSKIGSVPSLSTNVTIPNIAPEDAAPIGGGLYMEDDNYGQYP